MKAVPSFLSKDFGLKLLALALAIVVYYVLKDSTEASQPEGRLPLLMKGAVDAER